VLHDTMDGGSADPGSLPLKEVGDPLKAVGGELIQGGEDGFLQGNRGAVVRVASSSSVLQTFGSFGEPVAAPLVEPGAGTPQQPTDLADGSPAVKELERLQTQVDVGPVCHGTSG